jgi:hypothetical protein
MTGAWQEQITGHFIDGLTRRSGRFSGGFIRRPPRPPVGRATDSLGFRQKQPQRNKQRLNAETGDRCYEHRSPSWLLSG